MLYGTSVSSESQNSVSAVFLEHQPMSVTIFLFEQVSGNHAFDSTYQKLWQRVSVSSYMLP